MQRAAGGWMVRLLLLPAIAITLLAQPPAAPPTAPPPAAGVDLDRVLKHVDDLMWHFKLGDIADVDKVEYTSVPPLHIRNPKQPGANNPLIIRAHTFIPKNLDRTRPQPLIVFAHQGIHANSDTRDAHVFRELLEQGYSIISPEYRGSTGYGRRFYEEIDYGGREVDDVHYGTLFMLETYSFLDPKRVGMIGWSHGGAITLLNIFRNPGTYAVAYAGVPVSDLVMRLEGKPDSYKALYSAPYHIGKSVKDDPEEYRKRSAVTHAAMLRTPLLIHANTNDEDVHAVEVQRIVDALKAAGRKFEYKLYQDAPGGHYFNRLDTRAAKESRAEIWRFLAAYLRPDRAQK